MFKIFTFSDWAICVKLPKRCKIKFCTEKLKNELVMMMEINDYFYTTKTPTSLNKKNHAQNFSDIYRTEVVKFFVIIQCLLFFNHSVEKPTNTFSSADWTLWNELCGCVWYATRCSEAESAGWFCCPAVSDTVVSATSWLELAESSCGKFHVSSLSLVK